MKNHASDCIGENGSLPEPFIEADGVRRLMNISGEACIPFVFGVDYSCRKGFFLTSPFEAGKILWEVEGIGNSGNLKPEWTDISMDIVRKPSYDEYCRSFNVIREGLCHGDSFLSNLTTCTEVNIKAPLKDIFLRCQGRYKFCLADEFVCFSPEPFVTISGGRISTFPMKGTRPDLSPEDEFILMGDYKEICEHNTIVDLLRNDLAMVSESVKVERFRYLERVSTQRGKLLQTSSHISGKLRAGYEKHLGDILFRMLPAGSISGAPKSSTLRLISDAEPSGRGWYCGVAGYFDGKSLRSGVMIRCIARRDDGTLWFHSGGGITVNSRPEDEYQEVMDKIYLPLK